MNPDSPPDSKASAPRNNDLAPTDQPPPRGEDGWHNLDDRVETGRWQADAMLLVVSVIWGSAFVAQRIAAVQSGIFWFNGLRFLLGALCLLPFYWLRRKKGLVAPFVASRHLPAIGITGALLWAGAGLQQAGLQYTTAGNAGFITGLYVVLIPIFLAIFWRRPARPAIWLAAGLATIGMFLLSTGGGLTRLNPGDILELAGAVMWALHVILIGKFVAAMDLLQLVIGQYLVCAVLSLASGLLFESGTLPDVAQSWGAILYTGLLSVGVGYTLQAAGQRVAPPADAAIILSTEAVFAALFGWLILDEILSPIQILGCAIIFGGMLLAQADVFRRKSIALLLSLLIAGSLLVSACQSATPTNLQPAAMSPTETRTLVPITTPPPILPTASPSPVRLPPTVAPALEICSPIAGYNLDQLVGMISNPYNPPPSGRDDPHEGVDLAVMDPSLGYALSGAPVQAALSGRVAMVIDNRFPYGNAIMIETPIEAIPTGWGGLAAVPTPAPVVTPHPALTCPSGFVDTPPHTTRRSLYLVYAHLQEPSTLNPGDQVTCGQVLGTIGQSGNALNPHLHLEARVGPGGASFPAMAHYDASASQEEMANYCAWRVSGLYQLFDPLQFLLNPTASTPMP